MCGEYGENFGRPHFHAIIFGYDFPDKKYHTNSGDYKLYRSTELENLWTDPEGQKLPPTISIKDPKGLDSPQNPQSYGFSSIGECNFDTSAYVARYLMKKVGGENAEHWYGKRIPEFCLASLSDDIEHSLLDVY